MTSIDTISIDQAATGLEYELREAGLVAARHTILRSGQHSMETVEIDGLYEDPKLLELVLGGLKEFIAECDPDVVVGVPNRGAKLVDTLAAQRLTLPDKVVKMQKRTGGNFDFASPQDQQRAAVNPRIVIVEGVITTGSSAAKLARVLHDNRQRKQPPGLIEVVSVWNRGDLQPNVPEAGFVDAWHTLVDSPINSFPPEDCLDCLQEKLF